MMEWVNADIIQSKIKYFPYEETKTAKNVMLLTTTLRRETFQIGESTNAPHYTI